MNLTMEHIHVTMIKWSKRTVVSEIYAQQHKRVHFSSTMLV
jgi:hypothetical protein